MEKKALEDLVKALQAQVKALEHEVATLRVQTGYVPYVQPTWATWQTTGAPVTVTYGKDTRENDNS